MSKKTLVQQHKENLIEWVSYWRANPHRFANEYLGLNLYFYQKVMIFLMNKFPYVIYIASRGQGKSYLVAVYAVVRCILFPGTKVILVSGVRKQANAIIGEKVMDLYNRSAALRVEIGGIRNISTSQNSSEVKFQNGSKIMAIVGNDNSRGFRGNVLVVDEYRLLKVDTVQQVIKPMGSVPRIPEFMTLHPDKYSDYEEDNVEIYLSSAWYKSEWSWDYFKNAFFNMLDGKKQIAVSIPYQIPLLHGLINGGEAKIQEIKEEYVNPFGFDMEYEGLFAGGDDKSLFKLEPLNKSRTLSKAFIPPTSLEVRENNRSSKPKKLSNMSKIKGEIRLIGLDVAMSGSEGGKNNDTAVFTLMRMIPNGEKYSRQVAYLESIPNAIISRDLALRMKQLYYDFEADYAVLDAAGIGINVYDDLRENIQDEERDIEYAPWAAINDDRLAANNSIDAIENIYIYKGSKALNHEIALELRNAIVTGVLKLPKDDIEKKEDLVTNNSEFLQKSIEEQQRELHTFQQTSALISELISLEYTVSGGHYVVKEVGNNTKDRYSSLGYTNHRANEIEKEMNQPKKRHDYSSYLRRFSWKKG